MPRKKTKTKTASAKTKKTAAKKTVRKKTAPKKTTRKTASKKTARKKPAPKKTTRKTASKKTARKKAAPKKTTKKTAPKKTARKKAAPKKTTKKTAPKKTTRKKTAPKKITKKKQVTKAANKADKQAKSVIKIKPKKIEIEEVKKAAASIFPEEKQVDSVKPPAEDLFKVDLSDYNNDNISKKEQKQDFLSKAESNHNIKIESADSDLEEESFFEEVEQEQPQKQALTEEDEGLGPENLKPDYNDDLEEPAEDEIPVNNKNIQLKKAVMYVSITLIMAVVVGFWFVGVKNSLSNSFPEQESEQVNLDEYKQKLDQLFDDAEQNTNTEQDINDEKNINLDEGDVLGQKINQEDEDGLEEITESIKNEIAEEKIKEDLTEKLKNKIEQEQADN